MKTKSADPAALEFTIQSPSTILPTPSQFPNEVVPAGLTLERQWYLYEKIRTFCSSNLAADLPCPKPLASKPAAAQASGKRKVPKTLSSKAKRPSRLLPTPWPAHMYKWT